MKKFICCFVLIFFLGSFTSCTNHQQLAPGEEQERKTRAQLLISRASLLMLRGDRNSLRSATSAIELARDLIGDTAEIMDALGCIEWRRGSREFATDYFKKAIKIDNSYSPPYTHLAFVAEENGDLVEAELLLRKALELAPASIEARNNYGALLLRIGQKSNARHELLKAIQFSDGVNHPILFNLEQIENTSH